jgi:hypothetical protein
MRRRFLSTSDALGIAVGEQSLTIAEVHAARGDAVEVRRTARMDLDTPLASADPEALGQVLSQFLRKHRFKASRVVIGVPAKWLVARERDLPPANAEQASGMLRLQAERLFSSELKELVFDYAGTPDARAATKVLLVAMPRHQLDRVVGVAEAAGLKVHAVLPSVLALAANSSDQSKNTLWLSLSRDAAELLVQTDSNPRLLRHLPVRGSDLMSQNGTRMGAMTGLGGELKRAAVLTPGSEDRSLVLCDGVGLKAEERSALEAQAGITLRDCPQPGTTEGSEAVPAIALGRLATRPQPAPVDFAHPRLAAPRAKRVSRATMYAAVAGAVLVLALGTLLWDIRGREQTHASMKEQLVLFKPNIEAAEHAVERVNVGRGWFEARPPILECLREVTLAFRDDEQIFVTNFTLRDTGVGQLSGKSSDDKFVLGVLNRLKNNPLFADVSFQSTQESGGNSRDVSFSLKFTFVGGGVPAPTAVAGQQPQQPQEARR